jgi:hypothetical protein
MTEHVMTIINIYMAEVCRMITDAVNISISLIILCSWTLVKLVVAINPCALSQFITCHHITYLTGNTLHVIRS